SDRRTMGGGTGSRSGATCTLTRRWYPWPAVPVPGDLPDRLQLGPNALIGAVGRQALPVLLPGQLGELEVAVNVPQVLEYDRVAPGQPAGPLQRLRGFGQSTEAVVAPAERVDERTVFRLLGHGLLDQLARLVEIPVVIGEQVAEEVLNVGLIGREPQGIPRD